MAVRWLSPEEPPLRPTAMATAATAAQRAGRFAVGEAEDVDRHDRHAEVLREPRDRLVDLRHLQRLLGPADRTWILRHDVLERRHRHGPAPGGAPGREESVAEHAH